MGIRGRSIISDDACRRPQLHEYVFSVPSGVQAAAQMFQGYGPRPAPPLAESFHGQRRSEAGGSCTAISCESCGSVYNKLVGDWDEDNSTETESNDDEALDWDLLRSPLDANGIPDIGEAHHHQYNFVSATLAQALWQTAT